MSWYRWKLWRFAWAMNAGVAVNDAAGWWFPVFAGTRCPLMWLAVRSRKR